MRRREDNAADLGSFAADVLRDPRKWSRRLGLSTHDTEDVMQDALVLLMEHQAAIEPAARWSWFVSVLRNRKLGLVRDRGRARAMAPALEAHLLAQPPPFPAPDAEIRDRIAAARWLIEQVCPSRRDVARLRICELKTLEEIAAATDTPIGTVRSRWERAKEDMRAALEREEAKRGRFAWLAALVALLSGLWALLAGSEKGSASTIEARSGVARSGSDASTGRPVHAAVVLASAAFVLASLAAHDRWEWPDVSAQEEEVARAFEVERAFLPVLSTSAEREREWSNEPPRTKMDSETASTDREMARGFLTIATSAIQRGDIATARDALRTYDFAYVDNPFSQQRAQLGATLAALDARSRRGLP